MIDTCQHRVEEIIIKRKRVSAEESHSRSAYDVIDIIVKGKSGTVVHTIFGDDVTVTQRLN